jgi:hypothetical protein
MHKSIAADNFYGYNGPSTTGFPHPVRFRVRAAGFTAGIGTMHSR